MCSDNNARNDKRSFGSESKHGLLLIGSSQLKDLDEIEVVHGDLIIQEITRPILLKDLIIEGDLVVKWCDNVVISSSVIPKGNVIINSCKKVVLPDNWTVPGNLRVEDSGFSVIPNGLKVGKDFSFVKTLVEVYTAGTVVGGSIDGSYSKLYTFPEDEHIKGNLTIAHCPMRHFPRRILIDGSLNISYTRVMEIGEEVGIGKSLIACHSMLMRLPDRYVCKGTLDVSASLVEELPSLHLEVWENLNISDTDILSLPDVALIKGGLIAKNTRFRTIPEDFVACLFAVFDGGKLEEIPEGWTLQHYISFKGCPVRRIGQNASRLGAIWADYSALSSLPDNTTIPVCLSIRGCPMETLPKRLIVIGDLLARGSSLKAIQGDLITAGTLDIEKTNVAIVPSSVVAIRINKSYGCDVPLMWVEEGGYMHVTGKYLLTGDTIWVIEERKEKAFRCSTLSGRASTWMKREEDNWRYGTTFESLAS